MFIVFEGSMGQGKTLSATAMAIMEFANSGRRIKANYSIDLNFINDGCICPRKPPEAECECGKFVREVKEDSFELLSYDNFVSHMGQDTNLYDSTVIIDEAYLWVDSRTSQSGYNKLMTYFMFQSRKRDVDLYVTTQQFENVDLRLRRNAQVRARCRNNKKTGMISVSMLNLQSGERRPFRLFGPHWYRYYDTKEIPDLQKRHTDITV